MDADAAESQFLLFCSTNEAKAWKQKYESHLKERKETVQKKQTNPEEKVKMSDPWICLPNLLKVFSKNGLAEVYPRLYEVVRIIAILPVTVVSCERAHSKVKLVNNYLRASMASDRLQDLIRISIERDIAEKIELDTLMINFKTSGNKIRKIPLSMCFFKGYDLERNRYFVVLCYYKM